MSRSTCPYPIERARLITPLLVVATLVSPSLVSTSAAAAPRGVQTKRAPPPRRGRTKKPPRAGAEDAARRALTRALAGIDTVPSAAALRRAAPEDTALALKNVALDGRVDGWIRLRAVSVLPGLGAESSAHLLDLANTAKLPERMRWWAAFGWLRSPVTDAAAITQSRRWLASSAWLIRDAAVRGLRYRRAPAVTQLLRDAFAVERHANVRAALRRELRRR